MSPQNLSIKLRGHHLICLHFFRGEGYNLEFVDNLREIFKKVKTGAEIEVCSGPDDVCKMCPYIKDTRCFYKKDAEPEIREMDRTALNLLRLKTGSIINWQHVKSLIPEVLSEWSKQYCNDCDWREVCEKVKGKF